MRLLGAALFSCVAFGSAFYVYWSFSTLASAERREMNAAAYQAQLFFDQREMLLRTISKAVIPSRGNTLLDGVPQYVGDARELEAIPLLDGLQNYEWVLTLTTRALDEIRSAGASIVYASAHDGTVRYAMPELADERSPLAALEANWISAELAARTRRVFPGGPPPTFWLRVPAGQQNKIFLFTPLEPSDADAGWIGLELNGVERALAAASGFGGAYALYDPKDISVLQNAPISEPYRYESSSSRVDVFRLWGGGLLPRYLLLSKSVGADGWRIVYYMPIAQMIRNGIRNGGFSLQGAALWFLMMCTAATLGVLRVRSRLVRPALRQYAQVADAVQLIRKLIDVAPVGLCLVRMGDGKLLLSNDLARLWLDGSENWRQELFSREEGVGWEQMLEDGRCVYVKYASISYRGESVVLCGISDISEFKAVERSLVEAKREADSANHAKTVFLTTLSHEIRTPLYGILGTLDLLSMTELNPRQHQYLKTVLLSSATLLSTLNDTLDLSRIEAGQVKLQPEAFSPSELVGAVLSSYTARAEEKGLALYATIEAGGPERVIGDVARIRQILGNLVNNAVKFTDSGRVVLRLKHVPGRSGKCYLIFQVTDTGIGIACSDQRGLFQPYHQASRRDERHAMGSGLGLSICWRLSEMMNGDLSIVSERGLGTSVTFKVELPVQPVAGPAEPCLEGATVHVRGAVPEVVESTCGWLQHEGANAKPYDANAQGSRDGAILLEVWPLEDAPPNWEGQRIQALPLGLAQGKNADHPGWIANAYSPKDIVKCLRLAHEGVAYATSHKRETPTARLGLNVLVAEDNQINQWILQEQLRLLGCAAEVEPNGESALARRDLMAFDLVLTDLNMPVVNGYELARTLRDRGYKNPIIGITAAAYSAEKDRSQAAGMDNLLLKPISAATLHQAITEALRAAGGGHPAPDA